MGKLVVAGGRTEVSGNGVIVGLGALVFLVVGLVFSFVTGAVETLGYESRGIGGNGLTSTKSGYSLGLKTVYFAKGQKFFAEYDTTIQKGSLIVHLYKLGSLPTSDTPYYRKISQSGKGVVTFLIQESGWYRMSFSGSVLGGEPRAGSYDLSYQIRWGIR